MMVRNDKIVAYILVNLDVDTTTGTIASKLKAIPEVVEAYQVYGTYDVMLKIETDNSKNIKDLTFLSIRTLTGVQKTITMISLETWDRIS